MGAAVGWEYGGARFASRMFTDSSAPTEPTSEQRMANLTRIPRLAYLTTALAAGALIVSANIANAKGDHHQGNNTQSNGARPHFVISGQPAKVKLKECCPARKGNKPQKRKRAAEISSFRQQSAATTPRIPSEVRAPLFHHRLPAENQFLRDHPLSSRQ